MPRPKVNPDQRFKDILPLWEMAKHDGSAIYDAESYNRAVHIVHRLNWYRKAIREIDEFSILDDFVVRAFGTEVQIMPRPRLNLSKLTSGTGTPYHEAFKEMSYEEMIAAEKKQQEILNVQSEKLNQKPFGLTTQSNIKPADQTKGPKEGG